MEFEQQAVAQTKLLHLLNLQPDLQLQYRGVNLNYQYLLYQRFVMGQQLVAQLSALTSSPPKSSRLPICKLPHTP